MITDEADEIMSDLFNLIKNRYQNNLESMRCSEFVFDYAHLLYYEYHKIDFNCGGLYTDSPDWIKNEKRNNNYYQ